VGAGEPVIETGPLDPGHDSAGYYGNGLWYPAQGYANGGSVPGVGLSSAKDHPNINGAVGGYAAYQPSGGSFGSWLGGVSKAAAISLSGINDFKGCIGSPSLGDCVWSAVDIASDVLVVGKVAKLAELGKLAEAGKAADTAGTTAGDLAEACANSFTGDTPVTLVDGKQKPISQVKVGDKVLATDPYTGQTKAEPVVALIRHSGEHAMVLVTLADGSVLDATSGHKIWDATQHTFVDASQLRAGDKIETDTGDLITIAALTSYSADLTAYNLQINQIHTYYAGTTPVLVHNSCTAASVLHDPSSLEGLTPSQVDDLARNAGYDVTPGKAGAANPATRYYMPGTNGSVGFRILPGGVAGQTGVKGGAYLRFFGGANAGIRIPLTPP
jgi:hypothetical protein